MEEENMLTQDEAWWLIALLFRHKLHYKDGEVYVKIGGLKAFGLCGAISFLSLSMRLKDNDARQMQAAVRAAFPYKTVWHSYFWPTDDKGAVKRFHFCYSKIKDLNAVNVDKIHGIVAEWEIMYVER